VDEQSIWKKEISFGRKRKEPKPEQTETSETMSDEPTSIWKKEISFGRKKKKVAVEQPVAAEPEAGAEAPSVPPHDESMWKRAVSFPVVEGEAPVAAAPDVVADASDGPVEASPEETVWTKEVSFSRATEPEPVAEVEKEPVAEEEPVGEEQPAAEEEPVAQEAEVVADASDHVQGTVPEAGPVEASPEEAVWTKEVSFNRATEPEPVVEEPTVVAEAPTETWSATPSLPVEPELPVVAAAPAEEKSVPFWKKEISLGGKKREKAPKAERAPKQKKEKEPREPRERKPKAKVKAARGGKGAGGKRLVGLKVGASQLAAARIANNGSAELLQVAREPLEPGIVVGGELRDPDALAAALKDFFTKHKLPKKGVRLGIANNRIGVRTFDIAGINDQKQLTNAIRFRAQEALPIPIDEAVLDYQVLGEGVDDEGQATKRILLVVAYRELVDRYMDACKKAGIQLVGIDLEAFALLRALQAPQEGTGSDPSAALVAVAIGHDRSTFAVSDGRICEFTRVLEWGGSALNVAIARALDAAPSEVDGVKRALALTDEMVPEGLNAEQAKKARDAMRRAIQTFARELVSSLQYYQNQPGSLGIGEIVLTGGTAHLHGLAGELERLIGVRVRVGDPLARMKVSKKVGETEQVGSLAVAIGLGIED
jgi:type IV pilus assembly protein PilM